MLFEKFNLIFFFFTIPHNTEAVDMWIAQNTGISSTSIETAHIIKEILSEDAFAAQLSTTLVTAGSARKKTRYSCAAFCVRQQKRIFVYEDKNCTLYRSLEWVPLLRSTAGSGSSLYNLLISPNSLSTNLSLSDLFDSTKEGVFKSPLVDSIWADFREIKIELLSNNEVVAFITFGSTATAKTTWMRDNTVINSSWPSIGLLASQWATGAYNYCGRRFFVLGTNGNCSATGWLAVVEQNVAGCCPSVNGPYPMFLYAPSNEALNVQDMNVADLFLVVGKK